MNAVHATPSGVVEIAVSQTANHVVLTVTDPGVGLPPEFLPRAFDRFTRSERSRASGVDGSGLGLTLVQALVRASGGRVRLENRAEGGAIATVEIPSGA